MTQVRTYSVHGNPDPATLPNYPLDTDPNDTWNVRRWGDDATNEEVVALVRFLSEQRGLWAYTGKYPAEVNQLDAIMRDLSSWLNHSVQRKARISYMYSAAKPGAASFVPEEDWLYFYYLSPDRTAITEITNAFP